MNKELFYKFIAPAPKQLAEIAELIDKGIINHQAANEVIEEIIERRIKYAIT